MNSLGNRQWKERFDTHGDNYPPSSANSRSSTAKFGVSSICSETNENVRENLDFQERFLTFLKDADVDIDSSTSKFYDNEEEEDNNDLEMFDIFTTNSFWCSEIEPDKHEIPTRVVSNVLPSNRQNPFFSKSIDTNDGVYRSSMDHIKESNYSHLHNRLLAEDPEQNVFFNEEGEMNDDAPLVRCTLPINNFKTEVETFDKRLIYCFAPAQVLNLSSVILTRKIRIEITKVDLMVHYLSSKANILTKQIVELYKSISRETELSRVEYYNTKITLLRNQLKETKKTAERRQLLEELVNIQELRDTEESKVREIRDALLESWHALKDIQEATFVSAPFTLKWLAKKRNASETQFEQVIFERELNERAKEIAELEKMKNNKEIDTKKLVEKMRENRTKLGLRQPGETTWEPILKQATIDENQEIPNEEVERRTKLSKTKIRAVIRVSKNPVKTQEVVLQEDMSAIINTGAKIMCASAPHFIIVELWENGSFGNSLIGTVRVPVVNGVPSSSSTTSEPIAFTSDKAIGGCLIQGTLAARAYVEPDKLSCETVLHDNSQMNCIRKTLKDNPSMFINVPHFLEMNILHDPNDPYYQEKLDAAHVAHDPQLAKGSFKLDEDVYTTKFSSMAPLKVHSELPIRAFTKEPTKKSEEECIERDDVIESNSFSLKQILRFIGNLFARKRPLSIRYIPQERTTVISSDSVLSTRIVSAMNVPNRKGFTGEKVCINEDKPRVFARVSIGNVNQITDPINLDVSEWKDTFTFNLSQVFSSIPSVKGLAQHTVRIDLFDYVDIYVDDEGSFEENRFIATLEIPMKALIFNDGIDATVPFISHPIQFGYHFLSKPIKANLFAVIVPKLILTPDSVSAENKEGQEIITHVDSLIKNFKAQNHNFRYIAYGADSTNKAMLLSRYILPQNTPKGFDDAQSLLRFVSAIPFSSAIPDPECPIICTPEEIFKKLSANNEEHAVILCNYLLSHDYDSYVVIGNDVVNGPTAFVLIIEEDEKKLLDPVTCRMWNVADKLCTLSKIGTIFNGSNIWFNKQRACDPWRMSFNLSDPQFWSPLYNESFTDVPLKDRIKAIPTLSYEPPSTVLGNDIQKMLEYEITGAVEAFRNGNITTWNKEAGKDLRELLIKCENAAISSDSYNLNDVMKEFSQTYQDYNVVGAPFCVMTNSLKASRQKMLSDIKEEIKLREVFFKPTPNTEFARAALVIPYPNGIFAVWVIVVSMIYIK